MTNLRRGFILIACLLSFYCLASAQGSLSSSERVWAV